MSEREIMIQLSFILIRYFVKIEDLKSIETQVFNSTNIVD